MNIFTENETLNQLLFFSTIHNIISLLHTRHDVFNRSASIISKTSFRLGLKFSKQLYFGGGWFEPLNYPPRSRCTYAFTD